MKRLIFLSFISLCSLNALAQSENKSFLSITAGPSFPLGDFALKDLSEVAGQAKTGAFLDIGYGYRLSQYFGTVALLRGRVNGVDFSSYRLPDGTGASGSIESTPWKSGQALIGLFGQFPLSVEGRFVFDLRGLVGLQRTSSPEVDVSFTVPNIGVYAGKQESASASSFAYLFGAGLKYNFNRSLGLRLSADYNGSNPEFRGINVSGQATPLTSSQNTSTLDFGLGLVVGF